MQNKELSNVFKLTGQLLELHGANKFKAGSYSNASFKIGRLEQQLVDLPYDEIENVPGIGSSLATKIVELIETGESKYLNELIEKTPPGVIEMLSIKGIGPKKIGVIWKELEVESIGELLYACNENRLVDLNGFGAKTQEQVKKMIEFRISNEGKFHYAAVESYAKELLEEIRKAKPESKVELTGAIRRKCDIIDKVEILIGGEDAVEVEEGQVKVEIHHSSSENFAYNWLKTTAASEHLKQLELSGYENAASEEEIYKANNMPFIVPEMREGRSEFTWSKSHDEKELIEVDHLRGILHNHSTWSDGKHSLEEMAVHCKDLGYEYLGICDHSKSAFYANGLTADRVKEQHKEIDALNEKLAPFKVFKGIESDILNDGSLDYEEDVLASFDFIVASVHSNLKMDEAKATQRLLTAISNKYTTILGHPTGRLLLSREGYPIDHQKVIDACADHNVVLELNANPFRLDVDWRWIDYAMKKGVKISINPDAHAKEGYQHMYFGVCSARKGGLTAEMTFNTLSRDEIGVYFQERKNK